MKTSEHTDKLWPAIVKARRAMKNPTKDAENPAFKRDGKAMKYADLAAVLEAIDEAAHPCGLVTLQELTGDSAGVMVSTLIVHETGQWVQFDPLFTPAARMDPQGFGSAATYARRYAVKAAWNLADDDDDANDATRTVRALADALPVTNVTVGTLDQPVPQDGKTYVLRVEPKATTNPKVTRYTVCLSSGENPTTIRDGIAKDAKDAVANQWPVEVKTSPSQYGLELTALKVLKPKDAPKAQNPTQPPPQAMPAPDITAADIPFAPARAI